MLQYFLYLLLISFKRPFAILKNFCKKNNANYIIRGLRNVSDFEFEKTIALTNRRLSGIETVFFLTSAKNSFISSGIVRDLISNNGDFSLLIPKGLDLK